MRGRTFREAVDNRWHNSLRDKKESVSLVWAIAEAECVGWEIRTSMSFICRTNHRVLNTGVLASHVHSHPSTSG